MKQSAETNQDEECFKDILRRWYKKVTIKFFKKQIKTQRFRNKKKSSKIEHKKELRF